MFPSPTPDYGGVPPRRRGHRLVVRPDELIEVAHRFSRLARVITRSSRRLRAATSAVGLNRADPGVAGLVGAGLGPGVDRAGPTITGPAVESRWFEQVAAELTATVVAASEADAETWAGPGVGGLHHTTFASFRAGGLPPGPGIIDRVVGGLSVAAARLLLARLAEIHHSWDFRHGRWPGTAPTPRSTGSPRATTAPGPTFRRRTIGWLGPGRPDHRAGGRTSPTREHRARGARAVVEALDLTASGHWIRADEIGLITHGDGVYTVVLPGVTDLSRPSSGWDPHHRSVRDLDMAALDSARSSAVIDNRYAQMVVEALHRVGVEPGARLAVVGHSYGADTAIDLAADPGFNGRRYRVEYVVAAGYYSQPQLRHVPRSTDVVVLQNRRDLVIEAERLARWALAPMESLAAAVVGPAAFGGGTRSGLTVVGFDGGTRGAGHHPENYRRFVQRLSSRSSRVGAGSMEPTDEVDRFLTEFGAGSWGRGGRLDAVTVSVPM